MRELIDKKEVLNTLMGVVEGDESEETLTALDTAVDRIKAIKSNSLKPIKSIGKLNLKELRYDNIGDWIKCDEQMPPVGKTVIVTYFGSDLIVPKNGETVKDAIRRLRVLPTVTIATLYEDGDGEWCGPDGFPMMIQPMFWKPLPEPPTCAEVE